MQKPENVVKVENVRPKGLGVRHLQTALLSTGMIISFCMRVNMSMAIVDMTDPRKEGSYDWSPWIKTIILSSFFWGYVLLQIPSGELAKRFGGKILILVSVSVNSIASALLPKAPSIGGWQLVCAIRMLQGLTQAFTYPCTHHLISQWIPIEEKGVLGTFIYSGSQVGIGLQLMVSGFIATAWGWQAIFYVNATLAAIWAVAYIFLGSASPETSKIISEQEVLYIQRSLGRVGEQEKLPTPWLKIMTSLPFWAIIIAHCGQNWGFFTLMSEMPTYLSKVLGFNLQSNGVLSSLPYIVMTLLSFICGFISDLLIRTQRMSRVNTRRLFNTIGFWGPALALIGLSYATPENVVLPIFMLTMSVGINAGHFTGYLLAHIDLAPNFSANLMSITNFLANIISIIAPLVCGIVVKNESDPAEWRKVFFIAAGVYFFTNLFFIRYITADKQPWNEPRPKRPVNAIC
ncbi:putative inorganic phosphate cotransporter [Achroia grisella]|uniref:putative inorganic phosphate cotransporter n=1 Tax=Achroia grisella TaxID=688607 RepID=UPI0027D294C1|nr:putative inorganic phosphate cotransporter [Achroia grisella]